MLKYINKIVVSYYHITKYLMLKNTLTTQKNSKQQNMQVCSNKKGHTIQTNIIIHNKFRINKII